MEGLITQRTHCVKLDPAQVDIHTVMPQQKSIVENVDAAYCLGLRLLEEASCWLYKS